MSSLNPLLPFFSFLQSSTLDCVNTAAEAAQLTPNPGEQGWGRSQLRDSTKATLDFPLRLAAPAPARGILVVR